MRLGTGIGWRPEIADAVERMPGVDWVEAVAENVCPGHLPESLLRLRERGVTVVPHGVSLGLGGAERPDEGRLTALAERAEALGSPLVTEHIAFVRAGGALTASPRLEAGHLLPVPRTRDALDVLCENVRIAQDALPVPLAVENIAALFSWPGEEMTEGQFLYELADRTGVRLLIDVANLHTNHVNRGEDPAKALAELPLEALAYVHVAGGFERDGVWHDSHAHPVPRPVLDILTDLASRVSPPGVLLERDENFPAPEELERELDTIREALTTGGAERTEALPQPGRAVTPPEPVRTEDRPEPVRTEARAVPEAPAPVRERLALEQTALLSALVAGTPAPEGFDRVRLGVQARALAAKRADVVAKVAPELPVILGEGYRPAFLAYAQRHPMTGGYRQDALDFAGRLLAEERPAEAGARAELREWWQERSGPKPHSRRPGVRLARATRRVLLRR
ncbi:endonuclease [Streptomyces nigra]|nr:endonuclease [Streptomyces nigra]